MRIVVDHVAGSRRGQRQDFDAAERVRFGRHPENDVSFDAHRDLDASSRHAELRREGEAFVLRDIGSSNGLWVGSERLTEVTVPVDEPLEVEFGKGGPRVRLFIGDAARAPAQPGATAPLVAAPGSRRRVMVVAVAVAAVAAIGVALGVGTCAAEASSRRPGAGARAGDLSDNAGVSATGDSSIDGRLDAVPVV